MSIVQTMSVDGQCEPCNPVTPAVHPAFFFSRGPGTFRVATPMPKGARTRLVTAMTAAGHTTGCIVLRGGNSSERYDTDHEEIFRQESFFQYLFGVAEPDCWGIIELGTGRATLLIPRLKPEYAVWMGDIKSASSFKDRYVVDACGYTDECASLCGPSTLAAVASQQPSRFTALTGWHAAVTCLLYAGYSPPSPPLSAAARMVPCTCSPA